MRFLFKTDYAQDLRLAKHPGHVFWYGGAYGYNPTENTARVFIQLEPHHDRDVSVSDVVQRLRP